MNTLNTAVLILGVFVAAVTGQQQCSFGSQCSNAASKADVNGVTFCCLGGAVSLTIVNGQPECSCSGGGSDTLPVVNNAVGGAGTVLGGGGTNSGMQNTQQNQQPPSPSGKTVDDFNGDYMAWMAWMRNSGGGNANYNRPQYDFYGGRR